MTTVLSATNISKTVQAGGRDLVILQDINLAIKAGESVAILGSSGSGKTTLLSLLAGLDEASTGEITLLDVSLSGLDEAKRAQLRRQYVGFVFQNFQLLDSQTALENTILPMELKGVADAVAKGYALLERVGVIGRENHYPQQLSGGEQQRVAIARAFASEPTILFADEPTGNLDADTGDLVAEIMFELNREKGTTLVLVTHDQNLAARCGSCLKLVAGRLV